MASATSAAPPIATNNLPYADVIFIDDAKWRDEYLGGVFQPPVRRAAAKAMNKISEISMAASIGPTSPRRKSTGRSGRGRCGTAARGATSSFDFESSSEEESQRRHSTGGDDSGGGGGGSGDGGSGGVDHAGGIVPQKRPVSPMQGERSIRHEGGTDDVISCVMRNSVLLLFILRRKSGVGFGRKSNYPVSFNAFHPIGIHLLKERPI